MAYVGRPGATAPLTTADIPDGSITAAKVTADVATQAEIDLKANIASPTFTGTPAVPTASAATNTTQAASTAYVRTEVTNLIDSAPAALDTLNELAAALGDDANFSTTVTNSIATKLPLAGGTMTGNIVMGDDTSIGIADDAERIEFDGAGDISVMGANFGIGTTTPGTVTGNTFRSGRYQHLAGTDAVYNILESTHGSTPEEVAVVFNNHGTGTNSWWVGCNESATFGIASGASFTGGNTRLSVTEAGKVGIGTTAPDSLMELSATARSTLKVTSTDATGSEILLERGTGGSGSRGIHSEGGKLLLSYSGDEFSSRTDQMTILSDGNVGIGSDCTRAKPTGFTSDGKILDIASGGNTKDACVRIKGYSDVHGIDLWTDVSTGDSYFDSRGNHDTYDFRFRTKTAGIPVDVLTITGAGLCSGDFNDTSDEALKENILSLESGALLKINSLRPVSFDWKETSKGSTVGFIAQEVEKIFPSEVIGKNYAKVKEVANIYYDEGDEIPEGKVVGDIKKMGTKGSTGKSINTIGIVAHLTKAVQELSAKVTALENA